MSRTERDSPGAMLRTGFWSAPHRQDQTSEDRLANVYVFTSPDRSPIGLYPYNLGEMAARLGWDKHQVLVVLQRLCEQGEVSVEGHWILVHGWWDHNSRPGPGLQDKIARTLAEAPSELRAKWEREAIAAGIYPFAPAGGGPTDGGTGGTTPLPIPPGQPPTTPPGTRTPRVGNNNIKHKITAKSTTTTSSRLPPLGASKQASGNAQPEGGGVNYSAVPFPCQRAESCRDDFVHVCESNQLSAEEARNLAFELSARVNDGAQRPAFQIQQPRRWMETVVAQARSSQASILRVGTRYVEAERAAVQRAQEEEAAKLAAAKREQQARENHAALEQRLSRLNDTQRKRLVELALEAMPNELGRKRLAKIKESIDAQNLAGGLVGAAIRKALVKLGAPAAQEEAQ